MISLGMSGDFAARATALTWHDVLWGLENGVLSPNAAIRIAELRAAAGEDAPGLIGLASLCGTDSEATHEAVEKLVVSEGAASQEGSAGKWLFLALAWVRSRPDIFPDPLATAELLYADFGYPPAMKTFIRYMPRAPGLEGETRVQAEARMLRAWDEFVEREGVVAGWQTR